MKKHKPLERFDPWRDRKAAIGELLKARELGATLREGAAAAGVHVASKRACAEVNGVAGIPALSRLRSNP
jgi:hypothetical protein